MATKRLFEESFGLLGGAIFLMTATASTLLIYGQANRLMDDAIGAVRSKV